MRRIHYGWVIAAVTFLVLLAAAGFRSTVGVFVVPLEDEFGWSRAEVSLAIAINLVFYGLAAPFAAAFMERLGVRKLMVAGLVSVGGGSASRGAPPHRSCGWKPGRGRHTDPGCPLSRPFEPVERTCCAGWHSRFSLASTPSKPRDPR